MKVLRLITTILITLCVLSTGFYAFRLSTAGTELIGFGVTLIYLFFILLVLFSYRLTLAGLNKNIAPPSILVLLIIIALSLMYFNREMIPMLWNYTLAAFITLQGINLLPRISKQTVLQKTTYYLIIGSTLILAGLCIVRVNAEIAYTTAIVLLGITSLVSISESIVRKNN